MNGNSPLKEVLYINIKPKIKIMRFSQQQRDQMTREGRYISIPFKYSDSYETERQQEIRKIMNEFEYMRTDDEVELVIEAINDRCNDENDVVFIEAFMGTSAYNIDFGDIEVCILLTDEYHGQGDYDYSIILEGVIIHKDIGNERVKEVAKWLDKVFNG